MQSRQLGCLKGCLESAGMPRILDLTVSALEGTRLYHRWLASAQMSEVRNATEGFLWRAWRLVTEGGKLTEGSK